MVVINLRSCFMLVDINVVFGNTITPFQKLKTGKYVKETRENKLYFLFGDILLASPSTAK